VIGSFDYDCLRKQDDNPQYLRSFDHLDRDFVPVLMPKYYRAKIRIELILLLIEMQQDRPLHRRVVFFLNGAYFFLIEPFVYKIDKHFLFQDDLKIDFI
jgi:hypothetical protein